MKIKLSYLLTIIISILILLIGHQAAVQNRFLFIDNTFEHVRARVIEVTDRIRAEDLVFDFDDEFGVVDDFFLTLIGETLVFDAEVTNGARRGQVISAEQNLNDFMLFTPVEVKEGDAVLLINTGIGWYFNGFFRTDRIFILGIIFAVCVLLFGRKKGFNTLLSLSLTCIAVFSIFIPSILSGKNIYLMAILVCSYTTLMSLLLVIGYNKKALAAIIGCISGILFAGFICIVMDRLLLLTGVLDEHSRHLLNLPLENPLDLRAIIFAGIIIGAMGAIMDVSMSIASSLWEIREEASTVSFKSLLRSGLNIGRDILGSMANTLILAYIGSSLSVVLVLSVYSTSLMELLNREMIIVEILQALAGSFGILLALPLTALFCSVIYLRKEPNRGEAKSRKKTKG